MMFSRRAILLQGTALAVSAPISIALVSSLRADNQIETQLSFVGDDTVQITVIDTLFERSDPVAVKPEDNREWVPDPYVSFGSVGRLNGLDGYFSGDANVTQPQLFTAWPKVVRDSRLSGFRTGSEPHQKHALADQPEGWSVTVNGQPVTVVALYRKSTPIRTEALDVRRWDSTKRHILTFVLDQPIPQGAEFSFKGPTVATIQGHKPVTAFSEAVHVCQAGYPVKGPKKAYVGEWWGHDQNGIPGNTDVILTEQTGWRLIDELDRTVVRTGTLELVKPATEPHWNEENFNGCDIYQADFSDLDRNGDYHLHVDGLGDSFPFKVSDTPYADALRLAARWYYHQRSGCEIAEPYGEGRTRPRNGHPEDGLVVWQTDVQLGRTSEGYDGSSVFKILREQPIGNAGLSGSTAAWSEDLNPNAWGGWHDAGDWDRRVQHTDVVYHMAHIVEAFDYARTLDLNIPESGKPFSDESVRARKNSDDRGDGQTVLPDLIHEALWGISLWRRTQREDGGIGGGVEYSNSGIFGSVSWNPVQIAYSYGPEDWASYWFAFSAAKLGYVIKHVCGDITLGDSLIDEAVRAWYWAEQEFLSKNPYAPAPLNEDGTEPKPEKWVSVVSRSRVAAAASIYRASGDATALKVFEDNNPFEPLSDDPAEGIQREIFQFSYYDYLQAGQEGRPTNPEIVKSIKGWIRFRVKRAERMGRDFGLHSTATYPWGPGWLRFGPGSNWRAAHFALYFAANGELPPEMQAAVVEGMWFGLGCNPANVSFVQGLGRRDYADPLLIDGRGKPPIPGQISFGVAGGVMHKWEQQKTDGSIYPADQLAWPKYAQIFESRTIAISSEHDIKANAMEWLIACAMVNYQAPEAPPEHDG
ncbi:glycoside hydrolase family 9 protein [Ruegeria sp. HKCCD7221]|uniref:glycoside hydrolase family 9 protein n=1 Tax=Ruegeria sp. HKCCD7221 TaxID=2683009 RepID=UPI0014893BAB|nr:glycoside hydrolase family 9 protein [Ruegeria sp. HKCCD7221]